MSPAEIGAIHSLASDVPAVWDAAVQEERQTIVRLLLERILVEVVNGTEQVRVECHWQGGNRTSHRLIRPVRRLDTLSTYEDLVVRVSELHRDGHSTAEIAATLNREGWRPAKRRDTFNGSMVHHLLLKSGIVEAKHRRKRQIERGVDEWTIRELAEQIGMPQPTLYSWVQRGRLRCRLVRIGGGRAKLVHADEATIASLKAIRATPPPWRRLPSPLNAPTPTTT